MSTIKKHNDTFMKYTPPEQALHCLYFICSTETIRYKVCVPYGIHVHNTISNRLESCILYGVTLTISCFKVMTIAFCELIKLLLHCFYIKCSLFFFHDLHSFLLNNYYVAKNEK